MEDPYTQGALLRQGPTCAGGADCLTGRAQWQLSQHSKMPQYLDNDGQGLAQRACPLWLWAVCLNQAGPSTAESAF